MKYENPFPGMNPYLERRDNWPDFHDRLTAAIANEMGPQLPDNYRIAMHRRVEVAEPFGPPAELALMIPDALVTDLDPANQYRPLPGAADAARAKRPLDGGAVPVRMPYEVKVNWLRVTANPDQQPVTIVEVLSPTNKMAGESRRRYIRKREAILSAGVNLVEIDLLRNWDPMPLETPPPASDYRILICRSWQRPDALLYPFSVREAIPKFPLPLLPDDAEPEVDLGPIIAGMHHTARYNLVAGYDAPPPPPEFAPETQAWVAEQVADLLSKPAPTRL